MAAVATLRSLLVRTPLLVRTLAVYSVLTVFAVIGARLAAMRAATQPVQVQIYTAPVVYGEVRRVLSGAPARIDVERLNVSLPVEEGEYNALTGEWSLSDTAAFFATVSDNPNDYRGSTFIYGHNRQSVFAKLEQIRPGDEVTITTVNGHVFTYSYSRDAIIKPDMTDVLYEDPETPQLVLMTCDGLFSDVRRIMYFQLVGVTS